MRGVILRAWAILLVPVLAILLAVACHDPPPLTPADVAIQAANAALPVLVVAYRAEGDRAIARAPDKLTAVVALDVVRQRWAPIWRAWDCAREVPPEEVLSAWCELVAVSPVTLSGGSLCPSTP